MAAKELTIKEIVDRIVDEIDTDSISTEQATAIQNALWRRMGRQVGAAIAKGLKGMPAINPR